MAAMFIVYIWIRCRITPSLGPTLPPEELAQVTRAEKLRLLRAGILPLVIFVTMMVPFVMGYTSLVESSVVGAMASVFAAVVKGRFTREVFEVATRETLAISCMFMWIILAALAFGAVFDGLGAVKAIEGFFVDRLGLAPWEILLLMQLSYLIMGTFLDDTAMLVIVAPLYVPLVGRSRLRPDLVRRALHHHLPDRLHDPAVRLQPVPDAGDGAAGDHDPRHLPLDHARSSA